MICIGGKDAIFDMGSHRISYLWPGILIEALDTQFTTQIVYHYIFPVRVLYVSQHIERSLTSKWVAQSSSASPNLPMPIHSSISSRIS